MKKEDLFEVLENIDDQLIQRSEGEAKVKSKVIPFLVKASIIATCAGFVMYVGTHFYGGSNDVGRLGLNVEETGQMVESENATISLMPAYGFTMNDRVYFPISFEERREFGLIGENDSGLTAENTYVIEQKDIGEKIGEVEASENDKIIGLSVYHFNTFPTDDRIVILENEGKFAFYVSSNINLE